MDQKDCSKEQSFFLNKTLVMSSKSAILKEIIMYKNA
jgi:hypothetical protein